MQNVTTNQGGTRTVPLRRLHDQARTTATANTAGAARGTQGARAVRLGYAGRLGACGGGYMSDLAHYLSQADRIAQLEEELRLCKKMKSKYRSLWRTATGSHYGATDLARKLVRESKKAGFSGNIRAECVRIAKLEGLQPDTVRALWYRKASD